MTNKLRLKDVHENIIIYMSVSTQKVNDAITFEQFVQYRLWLKQLEWKLKDIRSD